MEWFEDEDEVGAWHHEELRLRLREELLNEWELGYLDAYKRRCAGAGRNKGLCHEFC